MARGSGKKRPPRKTPCVRPFAPALRYAGTILGRQRHGQLRRKDVGMLPGAARTLSKGGWCKTAPKTYGRER